MSLLGSDADTRDAFIRMQMQAQRRSVELHYPAAVELILRHHGHAAGPPIGMTDYQQGVPVRGDYVFRPNTWHSIELNATFNVPEWGNQPVRFALEEDAALLPGGKWDWVDGRQETFYLIKP